MKPASQSKPPTAPIPIVEEHVTVAKTVEETGAVRVRVESEQVQQRFDLKTTTEEVEVQRVAVNVIVDERRDPWMEDRVIVVPIYEEVLVRRLMLKEEVRLIRQTNTAHEDTTVPLRREHAVVERQEPDGSWRPVEPLESVGQAGGMVSKERESQGNFDLPSSDRSDS